MEIYSGSPIDILKEFFRSDHVKALAIYLDNTRLGKERLKEILDDYMSMDENLGNHISFLLTVDDFTQAEFIVEKRGQRRYAAFCEHKISNSSILQNSLVANDDYYKEKIEKTQREVANSTALSVSVLRKFFGLGVMDTTPYLAVIIKGYPKPYYIKLTDETSSNEIKALLNSLAGKIESSKELNILINQIYSRYKEVGMDQMVSLGERVKRFHRDKSHLLKSISRRLNCDSQHYCEVVDYINISVESDQGDKSLSADDLKSISALVDFIEDKSGRRCASEIYKLRKIINNIERDIGDLEKLDLISNRINMREYSKNIGDLIEKIESPANAARGAQWGKAINSLLSPAMSLCSSIVTANEFRKLFYSWLGWDGA